MAYGRAAAAPTSSSACSQLSLNPMPKPARIQPDVRAHDPRQQDVADLVVDRVGPVDPALLDQDGLQPELRGDGGHLPGVVGLDAADRDQRVGTLGQRVGDEVLQLAGLVAAVGEAAVAVLALGPDRGAAEVRAEPLQRMHRARAEQQRVAREVLSGMSRPYDRAARGDRRQAPSGSARMPTGALPAITGGRHPRSAPGRGGEPARHAPAVRAVPGPGPSQPASGPATSEPDPIATPASWS